MQLQEVLSEYQYRNVGQFRSIAQSLGYKEKYNNGDLCFTLGNEEFRTTVEKIRACAKQEPDFSMERESMERICKFFDKEKVLSPEYKTNLKQEGVDIINWGNLNGDVKDRFTVIDHRNKICYTGKDLYDFALQNNYILDGRGTQLEKGVMSDLTHINGKQAKVRLNENGVSVFYRKEALIIPDSILGKKLSDKQKKDLLNGNVIVLSAKKGDVMLQVDKELNSVVIRSEKELTMPSKIGEYKLTAADKYLLANGYSLENKLLKSPEGKYLVADISMTSDKKGYQFTNIQSITESKAKEILQKKLLEGQKHIVGFGKEKNDMEPSKEQRTIYADEHGKNPNRRDMEKELKEAIIKHDYVKMANLREEGYRPSEEVIKGLSQDAKIDQNQAIVIEKLFGMKPEVQKKEEILHTESGMREENIQKEQELLGKVISSPELDKEFKEASEKGDFVRLSQLKEQGYQPSKEVLLSLNETVSSNTMIAVQKIFGLKSQLNTMGDVKLAHSQPSKEQDISKPLANTVNRMFADL